MTATSEAVAPDSSTGTSRSQLEIVTIGLLVITAATHLYAGVIEAAPPLLLAGLGFLDGVGLYLGGRRRTLLTVAAIPYTAVRIPLWYVVKSGEFTLVGYLDKTVQVALVIALIALVLRRRQ